MALSQNDPRWKNIQLGTSEYTIGQAGCYLTSLCETARKLGHDITPDWLNARLLTMGGNGFVNGGLIARDDILSILFPDIAFLSAVTWYGSPTDMSFFDDGLTIVEIDSSPAKGIQTHFMPVIERQGDALLVDDSWDGQRKLSSAYRGDYGTDNIYKGIKYKAKEATMIIENADNWRARCNKVMVQMRGRELGPGELDPWYGQEFLHYVEAVSDNPEADAATNWQNVGRMAVQDNWQGQIEALTSQLADAKAALANEQSKPPKEVIKTVTQIVEKPVEVVKTVTVEKPVYLNDPVLLQNTTETLKIVKSMKGTLANAWGGIKKLLGGK